jgi:beta-1,4-mannosyl-glycoprotein beta-1,4-N-acetylglucosaminyltransferase
MKIVDGFTFYNELHMLEYRLAVLDEVVDYFVLVEATHTFAGKEKPLYYEENKAYFAKWAHKIIHVVVRDMPFIYPNIDYEKNEQWQNEYHQRDCIRRGYDNLGLRDEDVITIADVDEIIDPKLLQRVRSGEQPVYYHGVQMDIYVYNLHTNAYLEECLATRLVSCKAMRELGRSHHILRKNPLLDMAHILGVQGWHLTYFGDPGFIRNKIANFAHQEYNKEEYIDEAKIKDKIIRGIFPTNPHNPIRYMPVPSDRPLPPLYDVYLRGFYASP